MVHQERQWNIWISWRFSMKEIWVKLQDVLKNGDIDKAGEFLGETPVAQETVNFRDSVGWMLLHEAALKGHLKMAEFLLSKGADVNAKTKKGATALHHAAYQGHLEMVQYLVSRGADVNVRDQGGDSPLTWAEMAGHDDVAAFLRGQGAKG
jgi:ankyrin repeat protein